jgi:hypothetical protein
MNLENYLGNHVSRILEVLPFKNWRVDRSLEEDLAEPIIQYVFTDHGLELRCDKEEKILSIFLDADAVDGYSASIVEIPFSNSRKEVLVRFGIPSKSGAGMVDPILGAYGAWDRFTLPNHTLHIEYRATSDCIKRITFMVNEITP